MSCKQCGIVDELEEFTKDRSRPSGYKNICKPCHRQNQKTWREANPEKVKQRNRKSYYKTEPFVPQCSYAEKRKKLDEIKHSRTCHFCGEDEPVALDFHHRNQKAKAFTISKEMHKPLEVLLEEVAKCEVICSNCHRKLHAGIIRF